MDTNKHELVKGRLCRARANLPLPLSLNRFRIEQGHALIETLKLVRDAFSANFDCQKP